MDAYLNEVVRNLVAQSWQIALLTVAVAGITFALRNRSAHVRYLLWLIVLAKCLVPPLHPVPLRVLPQGVPETVSSVWSPSAENWEGSRSLDEAAPRPAISPPPVPSPSPAGPPHEVHRLSTSDWLGIAWALGAWAYLLLNLLRALRGHCWIRRSRRPLPAQIQAETENLLQAYGTRRTPPLWMIEGVGQPFVWGLVRGSIYVPPGFLTIESPQQRRDILAHELGHVLRYDAAVNSLQVVAQGLFWFHPLVWWANKKTRQEREKVCDEMAVARLGSRPKEYSTAIVSALIQAQESTRRVPSLAVAGPVKNLEERIKTMLTPGKKFYKRPSLVTASIIFLTAFVTVPTALVLTARAQTEPPKAKTNSPQTLHQAAAAGDIEQVRKLLAQGADVNEKDKDGSTPLHEATGNGWIDVVQLLLEKGANVEAADASGRTPLHRASRWGTRYICALLLDKGASVKATDSLGNTVLHAALGRQEVNRSLFELLLAKGADVNARNEQGETPLHLACRAKRPAVYTQKRANAADILLAHGAEVNATDKSGRTPLHVAAESGQDKVVRLLLAKGAAIEAKNAAGATALNLAVRNRFWDIVELLVNGGADVNSTDSEGTTPLHYAAQRGDNETVERLIAKGADVNAKNTRGWTPALLAAMWARRDTVTLLISKGADISSIQLAAYLGDLARVKDFLENEVDVNTQGVYSPLHAAALGGHKEVAEFLLSKGVSVSADAPIPSGTTPLHCAALAGSADVAELLIGKGAEIDAKNKIGMTPLHFAASIGESETARLLVAQGADVNAKREDGWTPLLSAAYYGHKDLVLLLLDHGADMNAQMANGAMPSDLAAEQGHEDVVRLLIDKGADLTNADDLLFRACRKHQKDLVELLIRKGADVNSKAWGNDAPALEVVWHGGIGTPDIPRMIGILRLLLDNGADPNPKDSAGWSPLHYVCDNTDLTKLLLDEGANPNVRTRDRTTPLHLVADTGNTAVAQLLISRGADVNAKDFYGSTPLSIAENLSDMNRFGEPRETPLTDQVKAAKKEIAELLREHGAKE
jgi:ankyrin repeat protein